MKRKPKVIVLRTAGTNCDKETAYAFETLGAKVDYVHINKLFSKEISLLNYELLAISGGFSYGDDVAAGKVLANELKYRLFDDIREFIKQKRLIIGICNGFQVLIKSGLFFKGNYKEEKQRFTLSYNDSDKFECRWIHLKKGNSKSPFLCDVPDIITLPIAHAEGKFVADSAKNLKLLENDKQIAFTYHGFNPNGSVNDIAGISNKDGNVLGLMPHPERFFSWYQYPKWTSSQAKKHGDGYYIFSSAIKHIKQNF